jgi:hypothetical protein
MVGGGGVARRSGKRSRRLGCGAADGCDGGGSGGGGGSRVVSPGAGGGSDEHERWKTARAKKSAAPIPTIATNAGMREPDGSG